VSLYATKIDMSSSCPSIPTLGGRLSLAALYAGSEECALNRKDARHDDRGVAGFNNCP